MRGDARSPRLLAGRSGHVADVRAAIEVRRAEGAGRTAAVAGAAGNRPGRLALRIGAVGSETRYRGARPLRLRLAPVARRGRGWLARGVTVQASRPRLARGAQIITGLPTGMLSSRPN